MKQQKHIRLAIEAAGGLTALANVLGVRPPTVHQWMKGLRPVPLRFCLPIEEVTKGRVTRYMLRPDDAPQIWPELKEASHA